MIRMLQILSAAGLLVAVGWFGQMLTSHKIWQMRVIRGMEEGAVTETKVVTDKWKSAPIVKSPTWWIAWNNADIREVSKERMNLPKEVWEAHTIGGTIDVVYVPGDKRPFHRDGIFAADENFIWDKVFLFIEKVAFWLGIALVPIGVAAGLWSWIRGLAGGDGRGRLGDR